MFKLKAALRGVGLSELIRQLLVEAPPTVAEAGLRCVACGSDRFETVPIRFPCLAGEGVVTVNNFPAYRCETCGETVTDLDIGAQVEALVAGLTPGSEVQMHDLLTLEGVRRLQEFNPKAGR